MTFYKAIFAFLFFVNVCQATDPATIFRKDYNVTPFQIAEEAFERGRSINPSDIPTEDETYSGSKQLIFLDRWISEKPSPHPFNTENYLVSKARRLYMIQVQRTINTVDKTFISYCFQECRVLSVFYNVGAFSKVSDESEIIWQGVDVPHLNASRPKRKDIVRIDDSNVVVRKRFMEDGTYQFLYGWLTLNN